MRNVKNTKFCMCYNLHKGGNHMAKKIDSHVQISKAIIKEFRLSKDDGNVYALNLKTLKISVKGPRKIGTINGYYNAEVEKELSDIYETPVGNIIKTLKDVYGCLVTNKPIASVLDSDVENFLIRFQFKLMSRDPSILEGSYEKSVIAKGLGIKPTNSGFSKIVDKTNPEVLFKGYRVLCIFNTSSKSFVSSISGYCVRGSEPSSKQMKLFLPLGPKIALHFVDGETYQSKYAGQEYLLIDNSSINYVESINNWILEHAIKNSNDDIYSNDRGELERLNNSITPPTLQLG